MGMKKSVILQAISCLLCIVAIITIFIKSDKIVSYGESVHTIVPQVEGYLEYSETDTESNAMHDSKLLAMLFSGDYFTNQEGEGQAKSFSLYVDLTPQSRDMTSFVRYKVAVSSTYAEAGQDKFIDALNSIGYYEIVDSPRGQEFVANVFLHTRGVVWRIVFRQDIDIFFSLDAAKYEIESLVNEIDLVNSPDYKLMPLVKVFVGPMPWYKVYLMVFSITFSVLLLLSLLLRYAVIRKALQGNLIINFALFLLLGIILSLIAFDVLCALINIVPTICFRLVLGAGKKENVKALAKVNAGFQKYLHENEERCRALESRYDIVSHELDATREMTQKLGKENREYVAKNKRYEDEIANLEKAYKEQEQTLRRKNEELKSVRAELSKLSSQTWENTTIQRIEKSIYDRDISDYKIRVANLNAKILELETALRKKSDANKKSKEDYEALLGLEPGYTKDDLSRARKALAKEYHEDMLTNLPEKLREYANSIMSEINIAYEHLEKLL